MIRIWCEWDLGQDYYVFTDEEKALAWLNKAVASNEDLSDEFSSGQQVIDEGLAGFKILTVIDWT